MTAPSVAFATLGCRLNQVESQEMLALLEAEGFRRAEEGDRPDVYVVNTCTVTGRADFSDRQMIRRISRQYPATVLLVTGCYAQVSPEAVARIPGVDLVLGTQEKYRIPALLGALTKRDAPEIRVGDVRTAQRLPVPPVPRLSGRSRAFLKVQDGCQHRCAFCIVPTARGSSRSQEPKAVLEQLRGLIEAGYREITITGVDLGHYGWDLVPRTTLAALIRQAGAMPGLRRLRLSSLLPAYVSPELVEAVAGSPVVAPHFHLPLQSGSDRVLRVMRRPYNVRMYRRVVERLVQEMPGLGLGADVIVGHPGETDGDFQETLRLVRELPFSYLHVFAYSDRKGTEAGGLAGRVRIPTIRERSRALRALAAEKNLAFRRAMIGTSREALLLETRDRQTGLLTAVTDNYVEVLVEGPDALARRFANVTITAALPSRTLGTLGALAA